MATTSSAGGWVTTASSVAPVATDFAAVPGRAECGATVLPGEEQLFSDGLGPRPPRARLQPWWPAGKRWFIRGTEGPDNIWSFRVPVVVRGLGGNDHLSGSLRDDVLDGGPGYDRVRESLGDDRHIAVEKIVG